MSSLPSPHSASAPASLRVQTLRALSLALLLTLIALGAGWELWWAPLRPGGSTLVIKVLPLCFAIAGLLRHRLYTYRWLSLLVWLYVAEGAVRLWSDTSVVGRYLAWGELLLAIALFAALTTYIRTRLKNGVASDTPKLEVSHGS